MLIIMMMNRTDKEEAEYLRLEREGIILDEVWNVYFFTEEETELIFDKLIYDDKLIDQLLYLYNLQTDDEKSIGTFKRNNIGFNSYDSDTLSKIAKSYIDNGFVTETKLKILSKRLPKYHKQL